MKTIAIVNSTSGTKRATEMGPVHLHNNRNIYLTLQQFTTIGYKKMAGF